jgi:hypothetical protein
LDFLETRCSITPCPLRRVTLRDGKLVEME